MSECDSVTWSLHRTTNHECPAENPTIHPRPILHVAMESVARSPSLYFDIAAVSRVRALGAEAGIARIPDRARGAAMTRRPTTPADIRDWINLHDNVSTWTRAFDQQPIVVTVSSTGAKLELRRDVPETRGDCPETRPCGHVRCKHHLWSLHGEDRGGRWGEGNGLGIRAGWTETPTAPSCSLDMADIASTEKLEAQEIAHAMRVSDRRLRQLVERAKGKLMKRGDQE